VSAPAGPAGPNAADAPGSFAEILTAIFQRPPREPLRAPDPPRTDPTTDQAHPWSSEERHPVTGS
jgi:hypothetical protein